MNVNLTPNITGKNVNIIKGATQADLTNSVNNSKTYRDEAEAFSIVSEAKSVEASYSALNASISSTTASDKATIATTKANEASNSASIATKAIQDLTQLSVVANEGLTTSASYDDASNTLSLTLVRGEQGIQGIQGLKGDTGDIGPQGIQGPNGDTGDIGPQGIQGIQGPQGKGIDTVTSNKVGKTTTVTVTGNFDNSPKTFDILDGSDSNGDMLKSIYDTDNDGIVDNAEMLSLNTANTVSPTLGQVKWNQDEYTADLGLGNVILQLGQEQLVRVRNDNGSLLSNGTVVMATGTLCNSGRILVKPHTGTAALAKTIVGVVTEDIAIGADGFATTFGKVRGINTTGSSVGETWLDGDILYIKPNDNGSLTKVTPLDNELYMPVAFVIKAHTSGTLFIRINGVDENRNKLISGTSIKTVNNTSILGSGNIDTTQATITGNAGTATKLQTARTIGMTGDVTWTSASFDGSGDVTGTSTLSNSGVTASTYKSVTVDAKGRVTNGTNPTTLSGYGITDAQATLVSGSNIKTINSASILGSGNINLVDLTTNQSIGGIKTFTSSPIVPTPTNTTDVANKAYVDTKANLASPTFTGIPTAPTASVGTNTTQLATTAFVLANAVNVANFAKSLAANGYQKIIGGLIIQWGTVSAASGSTVTFPIAFPSLCASVVFTGRTGLVSSSNTNPSTTSFYWHDNTAGESVGIRWIAIGY